MYCLDRDVKKQFVYSISYPSFYIQLLQNFQDLWGYSIYAEVSLMLQWFTVAHLLKYFLNNSFLNIIIHKLEILHC